MGQGLCEDRFAALFDNMLTLWEATDFGGCETWFDRSQRVEAVFGSIEHRIDLIAMNYAVHRSIAPDARFDEPLRALVDRDEARQIFQANMMRVLMDAAGVWQKDNLEIARRYFG
ncbi:hypothetical protein [Caulobacter henricii]|uniref:Uncharacterized protein n=1 Tax=Caulobacter henricii TaxID=69395 RepID=A0A0P0P327_9CAUL|nr:hypothetical protein [Caulobacter henricii]ALL14804.1 hypothetical protein AQ619_16345 [Caulobacter henricii]